MGTLPLHVEKRITAGTDTGTETNRVVADLAAFVAGLEHDAIPENALRSAERAILDRERTCRRPRVLDRRYRRSPRHRLAGRGRPLEHDDPKSGLEAKFSMPYLVASAIVRDRVGLAAFDDVRINDPDVQAVRKRVCLVVDDDLSYDSNAARVEIATHSGVDHERVQEGPPGTHEKPLSDDELHEKFQLCAKRAPTAIDTDALVAGLDALRSVSDVGDLLEAC